MAKITDLKSLETWLKRRKPEVAVVIAVRAALRVLPFISEYWQNTTPPEQTIPNVLAVFRIQLVGLAFVRSSDQRAKSVIGKMAVAAARKFKTGGYHGASAAAALYALIADPAALDPNVVKEISRIAPTFLSDEESDDPGALLAFGNALDSIHRVKIDEDQLPESFWSSASRDASILEGNEQYSSVFKLPLWVDAKLPAEAQQDWQKLQAFFNSDAKTWGFWRDWYQKVLDGQFQNPELLYDIALLPESDWKAGPAVIAERIAGLQAKYLSAATPLAEVLRLREGTELIYAEPAPMPTENPLAQLLDMIRDALADAIDPAGNKLREQDATTTILRRMLDKYSTVPWRVHQDCIRAREALENEIKAGSLPGDDTLIEALRRTLIDVPISIRTAIPAVKAQHAAELLTRFEELPKERKEEVLDGANALPAISEKEFGEAVTEASETLAEAQNAESAKVAIYNLAGWITRSFDLLKTGGMSTANKVVDGTIAATLAVAINALAYSYRIPPYQDVRTVAPTSITASPSHPSKSMETPKSSAGNSVKNEPPKPLDNKPKPPSEPTLPNADRPRSPKSKGR